MSNGALAGQWSSGTVVPAGSWADEAMVFDAGRVVERGQVRTLLENPKETATKALVEAAAIRPLSQGAEPV